MHSKRAFLLVLTRFARAMRANGQALVSLSDESVHCAREQAIGDFTTEAARKMWSEVIAKLERIDLQQFIELCNTHAVMERSGGRLFWFQHFQAGAAYIAVADIDLDGLTLTIRYHPIQLVGDVLNQLTEARIPRQHNRVLKYRPRDTLEQAQSIWEANIRPSLEAAGWVLRVVTEGPKKG